MSEQPTAKEPIEDRILEHFHNRVVNEGKSPCDYHVHPLDFQDLVKRTGARVKEDHLSAFVDLAFSAGETSVFPDPQIVRGSCEPWERGQDANVIVTAPAFAVGDVVRLKSGGANMTVVIVTSEHVVCCWFQSASDMFGYRSGQAMQRERLPLAALERAAL